MRTHHVKALLILLLAVSFAPAGSAGSSVWAQEPASETTAASEETTAEETKAAAKPKKKGWVKKGKKARYYVNGSYVTGMKKIKKHYYLFDKKGWLAKSATLKIEKTTYYSDSHGYVEAYKKKKTWYYANGTKMKKAAAMDFETLQTAKKIAGKITKKSWSKSRKLKACFDWVVKKYYRDYRTFSVNRTAWPAVYANDHFLRGSGDCIADAAAFAYLARAVGFKKVYVCTDSKARNAHGWAEIAGRAYDPLFWQAKGRKDKYYGGTYKQYELSPEVRVKLS